MLILLIHVTESNNLVMPNDRVLLNELQPQVKYRNVKTGFYSLANPTSSFMNPTSTF